MDLARLFLAEAARRTDEALDALLPRPDRPPARLHEAMRYSALGGGKRLRPALALATCRAFGGREEDCLYPAAALEMIHAYSLIHDDLPCMDDDDLRRGRPTNHVVFGEAMAILAGDALHTLACEVLATHPRGDDRALVRSRVQRSVLAAIGSEGMVGGQALDMEATGQGGAASESGVEAIHSRKTGALIRASLELGALLGGADDEAARAVARCGAALGLAFQVVDDILDVTSDAAALGKSQGKDAAEGKVTYPAVLGLEGARRRAEQLTAEALRLLEALPLPPGDGREPLRALTRFVLERTS